VIGASDIEFYRLKGYLLVEDVVPAADIDTLRRVADKWVEVSRGTMSHDELFDLEPGHSPANPQVRRVKNPAANDEAYAAVMGCTAILDIVECLIGPNIRWQGSKLNMKSAGVGSPVGWHQDWAFYPHTNDDLLAVGVPIDDMTIENGCLLVLPGSHNGPVLDHHDNGVFDGVVAPDLIDRAACVPLEAKAGSITLHHVRLLHGSAPNTSGHQRRLFLIEYNAADAWPLGGGKWERFESSLLRGEVTKSPRMVEVPVRLPLPPAAGDSIYQVQAAARNRGMDFERAS
jgi:hypothetical protein